MKLKNSSLMTFISCLIVGSIIFVNEWFFFKELIAPFAIFSAAALICETIEGEQK